MKHLSALALMLFWLIPAGAAEPASAPSLQALPAARAGDPATCAAPDRRDRLAQVSQTDCCKGHKGVCGCRAGKIVCCDNTVSASCTCHADDGLEN